MSIKVAERLRPFSHLPGSSCLLPKSNLILQIFPSLIRFNDLQEIPLDLQGPVKGFTIVQDLEKGRICVHGKAVNGFFRYFISQEEKGVLIQFDKYPIEKENLFIFSFSQKVCFSPERLSLGMHKAQNWELIRQRADLKEIFPLWLKLAHLIPESNHGENSLLEKCRDGILKKEKENVFHSFLNLFHVNFYGMLVPRLHDAEYQGFSYLSSGIIPHFLLKEGAALIRSLFFQEKENKISLLPCLPPQCHSGRYLNLQTSFGFSFDMEWSKKSLKKLIIQSNSAQTLYLDFPKSLKSYRLRTSLKDKGKRIDSLAPLQCDPGVLLLDCFQK